MADGDSDERDLVEGDLDEGGLVEVDLDEGDLEPAASSQTKILAPCVRRRRAQGRHS